jgi:hypothetical protein
LKRVGEILIKIFIRLVFSFYFTIIKNKKIMDLNLNNLDFDTFFNNSNNTPKKEDFERNENLSSQLHHHHHHIHHQEEEDDNNTVEPPFLHRKEEDQKIVQIDDFITIKEEYEQEKNLFYIPYKYKIFTQPNTNHEFKSKIYARSNTGKHQKIIDYQGHDSFLLLDEISTSKSKSKPYRDFITDQLKEYFSTTKVEYFEDNNYFHISPYSHIPEIFYNNNNNRIFKLSKNTSNLNKYHFSRNFFDIIDKEMQDIGPLLATTTTETVDSNPFSSTFSDKSNINFAAFKTVVWSMINKDTLVFNFINSSYKDSEKVEPYTTSTNIHIYTFNQQLADYFTFLTPKGGTKPTVKYSVKMFSSDEDSNNSIISSFISFVEKEADICINYGEKEFNTTAKKIFDKISLIDSIQNINIEEFFRNYHSYYDDHSLIKICKYMNFEENSTEENKIAIETATDTIKKLNENIIYGENFLTEYLNIENIPNKELFIKNIENFIKQIISRVIIVTKIWINYSKNFFDLAQISNTNFDDIVKNRDEIVKGIIGTNYSLYQSNLIEFFKKNMISDNSLKKNIFYRGEDNSNTDKNINVISSVTHFLKFLERNESSLSDFEKFFYSFFKENTFLQSFYWIFFRFFDSYNTYTLKKCISDSSYKQSFDSLYYHPSCLGIYKGMLYYFDDEDFTKKNLPDLNENDIVNTWNFILVLQQSDSWIGTKFFYGNSNSTSCLDYHVSTSTSSPRNKRAFREDIYGYFGTNIVCKHPFLFLKNMIEFYFSFYFSDRKFLNIDDHNLFKNINLNYENTRMIKNLNSFSKDLFVDDIGDLVINNENNSTTNVWYNSQKQLTTMYTDCELKLYINKCITNIKLNIISCIKDYIQQNEEEQKKKNIISSSSAVISPVISNNNGTMKYDIKTPNKFRIKKTS